MRQFSFSVARSLVQREKNARGSTNGRSSCSLFSHSTTTFQDIRVLCCCITEYYSQEIGFVLRSVGRAGIFFVMHTLQKKMLFKSDKNYEKIFQDLYPQVVFLYEGGSRGYFPPVQPTSTREGKRELLALKTARAIVRFPVLKTAAYP